MLKSANGFSLLEVLLAVSMLGVITLEFFEQKIKIDTSLQQTYYKNVAMQQMLSMSERFYSNKDPQYRLRELQEWKQENSVVLPQGVSEVNYLSEKMAIKICWKYRSNECLAMSLPY